MTFAILHIQASAPRRTRRIRYASAPDGDASLAMVRRYSEHATTKPTQPLLRSATAPSPGRTGEGRGEGNHN
jgi:hypothetical protein